MGAPEITIAVIPREQFSKARASLESIFAHTTIAFRLVYIDGNSPGPLRQHLEEQARARQFDLIRVDRYIASNEARNLALSRCSGKYVVFMDNDVLVSPGWLEALVACAEETGAWVVGPVYCAGDPAEGIIHMAGSDLAIVERAGRRYLHEAPHFCGKRLSELRPQLKRCPTGLAEFHCLLIRRDVALRLGGFDRELLSYYDHVDLCLLVRAAGGEVYLEPDSVVTYRPPPPFAISDIPFFLLRWSDRWMTASQKHFCAKHGLDPEDPNFEGHLAYRLDQRRRLFRQPTGRFRRILGIRGLRLLDAGLDAVADLAVVDRLMAKSGAESDRGGRPVGP